MRALLLLLAPLLLAQENPIRWSVTEAPKSAVPAGSKFAVKIEAVIPEGWHLYSLTQPPGGPIPTRIAVPEGQAFVLAGTVDAPAPDRVQDEAFGMEVESYEGTIPFTVPVSASKDAAGKATLTITARYQACSKSLCLPPRTVRLEVPVEVRK
ncbi:MAG: protein-disulfide reductase DsbD N-terminal domain-containing protein [Bryobacter sp.]|nr:protein-disulfide reductase DsbD N-terminal domain-containing protein [Bryobacter sp.]